MSEKKESKELKEKTEQVKEAVKEKTEEVKEKAKKHPKLVVWAKRIAWALIGALAVVFAPAAAGKLRAKSETTDVDTAEATEG